MSLQFLASFIHYAVDGIALLIILVCGFVCLKKGFIRCLFGFVSTLVAILLALFLAKPLLSWTNGLFGLVDKVNIYICYLISFFGAFIVIKLITAIFSKIITALIDKIPLVGKLNHFLGFILGLAQGFFVVCGAIAILKVIPLSSIQLFANDCLFVGWLYNSNPLHAIFSWIVAR